MAHALISFAMGRPIVQIQARLASSRLPGKVLYNLGNRRIIGWVVRRSQEAERSAETVVSIGDKAENDALIEWCERSGIRWYQGSEDNLLERHRGTAHEYDADPVVRITGDCPFVPPGEIDRVIQEHDDNDARYTTNRSVNMPLGSAVDVLDRDLLDELADIGENHPVECLLDAPDDWNVAIKPSKMLSSYPKADIAIDTPEDYWRLTDAIREGDTEPEPVIKWMDNCI